jgi:proton-dependent oligopeptide transporter, POT family
MVNVGGSFGPIVAGKLRAISWNYAFLAAAIAIGFMLLITIIFYKEPPRKMERETLGKKFRDIGTTLADLRFSVFLLLLGVLFWLPFWSFFNLCALYVDSNLNTAQLYLGVRSIFGQAFADFFSRQGDDGTRHILGETISHTGYIIMILQLGVSRVFERMRAMPSFMIGLIVAAAGLAVIGLARSGAASLVFLGIFLFAIGEMITSPRIQEYITWIAPKEKAGLYMGSNFLAVMIGGFTSGFTYTSLYGRFSAAGAPERVWFILAAHTLLAVAGFWLFVRVAGEFKEQEA